MKSFLKLLPLAGGAVLVAILFSGCSVYFPKQPYTSITYLPQTGVTPVVGAREVTVNVEMVDSRSTKYKVSDYEGGEFSTAAGIMTTNTAAEVLQSAIEAELTNRGDETTEALYYGTPRATADGATRSAAAAHSGSAAILLNEVTDDAPGGRGPRGPRTRSGCHLPLQRPQGARRAIAG